MSKFTCALAQIRVEQSSPGENLKKARSVLERARSANAQLICFPEMWTTGFHWKWNRQNAGTQNSAAIEIERLACEFQTWICGSILQENTEGQPANACILFSPEGIQVARYDKTHLFGPFQEQKNIAPGKCPVSFEAPWGKTGFSICYDVRFPELFRCYATNGATVQLLPAAFPAPRREHWLILLRARAIENQMYVIATNQVGPEIFDDGSETTYFGSSMIVDPLGNIIAQAAEDKEELLIADIDPDLPNLVRNKMNVLEDRRPEVYRDPEEF
jgi:predicted amidohydrolase